MRMNSLHKSPPKTQFCLDTPQPVQVNPYELSMRGWYTGETEPGLPPLKLVVDDIEQPLFCGVTRPDVAESFDAPDHLNCGFVARFPVPTTESTIKILARRPSGDVLLAELRIPARKVCLSTMSDVSNALTSYQEWLARKERSLYWPESEIADRTLMLTYQPRLTVVLTYCDETPFYMHRSIQSLLQQQYPHWELCVPVVAATGGTTEYLNSIAASDARIRRIPCRGVRAAAEILDSAMQAARGDFLLLLEPGDELHRWALTEVVRHLNQDESAVLIYSDEDMIDDYGRRSRPQFKPNFDIDALLAFNYFGGLVAIWRPVLLEIGGLRPDLDAACIWDLYLRTASFVKPSAVLHVPKPLYHRSVNSKRCPSGTRMNTLTVSTGERVISDFLCKKGASGTVKHGMFQDTFRIEHEVPKNVRIAVFVRVEDGGFQPLALQTYADTTKLTFYESVGCVVYPVVLAGSAHYPPNSRFNESRSGQGAHVSDPSSDDQPLWSMAQFEEDVFVFVNLPVETVSHFFFKELAGQALRSDCGLVTGISISLERKTLHTGFVRDRNGRLVDPFVNSDYPQPGYIGFLGAVRQVDSIGAQFFAVQRKHLAAAGGLGSIDGKHMPRLVRRLVEHARTKGLKILVTPYAVATFDHGEPQLPGEPVAQHHTDTVNENPNLTFFRDHTGSIVFDVLAHQLHK